MFNTINNDNLNFQSQITATNIDGSTVPVVDMYAHITSNTGSQAVNYTFDVKDKNIYEKNKEAINIKVEEFKSEIKTKAESLGLISL